MMLKEKSNPLRLFKYLYVFAAALFLGSCGEKKVTQGDLEVIPVGMALDQQTNLKVSREKGLEPIRVLDLGTHGWTFEERLVDKKDAIYPLAFMENQEVILFRFVTNLYNKKRKNYNALYRKSDGRVLVSPFDNKIIDDKNGFLPLQPLSVSVKGEFAALLPAEDVFNWFEGNGVDATLPAEIAALKKVGEEDNPVVAIME
ncbi:MAG: hypothetical protein IJ430_06810 [Parabacteroides sp.]|nr:hypothetical protein [Parabacteroides sp.]